MLLNESDPLRSLESTLDGYTRGRVAPEAFQRAVRGAVMNAGRFYRERSYSLPTTISTADLAQEAILGVCAAADRWDPAINPRFETIAWEYAHGYMYKAVRRWKEHIAVKRQSDLAQGADPLPHEQWPVHLSALLEKTWDTRTDDADVESEVVRAAWNEQAREKIVAAMERLTVSERYVVTERSADPERATFMQLASELGVSRQAACCYWQRGLAKLRSALGPDREMMLA